MSKKKTKSSNEYTIQHLDPNNLLANPLNPRKHGKRQREAYNAFVERLPPNAEWLSTPIFNKQTGHLLDGHMRVEEAARAGVEQIPVRVIDVDEETERYILEHFDAVGYLAELDQSALKALQKSNKEFLKNHPSKRVLDKLSLSFQKLAGMKGSVVPSVSVRDEKTQVEKENQSTTRKAGSTEEHNYQPTENESEVVETYINNDVKFPSSNQWGIPDLLPLKRTPIPTSVYARDRSELTPTTYYCHGARPFPDKRVKGILGFYTEDHRFEHIYQRADEFGYTLIAEDWNAVIGPDFSTYYTWPFALRLYNVYRSRWCLRLWQELGINVIPTIQHIGNRFQEVVIDTLPAKCPVVAMQCRKQSDGYSLLIEKINACVTHKGTKDIILYGGAQVRKYIHGDMPRNATIHYLSHYIVERKRIIGEKSSN